MTSADSSNVDPRFLANAMASFIQIGAVLILIFWCFSIVRPFVGVVAWGLIIAIALYPAHVLLTVKFGGQGKMVSSTSGPDWPCHYHHSNLGVGRFHS